MKPSDSPMGAKDAGPSAIAAPLPDADRPTIQAHSADAVDALEAAAGGRAELLAILSAHPALTKADQLALDLIADPRNDARKLSKVCGKGGITLGRLVTLLKDAKLAKAQLDAIDKIALRAAPVAETILDAAFRQKVVCSICEGTGSLVVVTLKDGNEIREPKACKACDGVGYDIVRPTTADRKLAAEVVGLVKAPGNVEVNVSATANAAALSGAITDDAWFAQFQEATDRVLYGDARRRTRSGAVEGEVIEESSDERRDADPGPADGAGPIPDHA